MLRIAFLWLMLLGSHATAADPGVPELPAHSNELRQRVTSWLDRSKQKIEAALGDDARIDVVNQSHYHNRFGLLLNCEIQQSFTPHVAGGGGSPNFFYVPRANGFVINVSIGGSLNKTDKMQWKGETRFDGVLIQNSATIGSMSVWGERGPQLDSKRSLLMESLLTDLMKSVGVPEPLSLEFIRILRPSTKSAEQAVAPNGP